MTRHKLIGGEVSLYTAKVRAYLRYKGIPFDEVLATRAVYRDVIVPRTGVRYIPVLVSDDDVAVQDSTAIIDFLEARTPEPSVYPAAPLALLTALLLETYADEWLVIPAMHYRWSLPENRAFAIEEFGRLSAPEASPDEQRAIGEKLAGPFAGALPVLGVTDATIPAIEASYLALLDDLTAHFAEHPFLFGTRPSIADFAFYGPLYAHLYRDPASGRLMRERAPAAAAWVERMTSPAPRAGQFVAGDALPPTLEPLLARMFREQGPVLASTIARLAELAQGGHEGPLPRSLGKHAFTIEGREGVRSISPFNVWRFSRAHQFYRGLTGAVRTDADALLARTGGLALLQSDVTSLRRDHNQLALA